MVAAETETTRLLRRWYRGDAGALQTLLALHLPWVRAHSHRRLGEHLRQRVDTGDVVQEACVRFLKYGPRVVLADAKHFRALLARIVENVLRDLHDRFEYALAREEPLPSSTIVELRSGGESPSQLLTREEREELIRLALELLDPDDRRVMILRRFEGLRFASIGERLGISEDAASKRCRRAAVRLTDAVLTLTRRGLAGFPGAQGTEEGAETTWPRAETGGAAGSAVASNRGAAATTPGRSSR